MMPKKFSISARAVSQIRLMIANYMQHPGATQVYPTIVWVSGSSKEDFTPHPSVGLSVAAEVPTEEIQWIGDFSFVFGVSATDLVVLKDVYLITSADNSAYLRQR